MTTAQTLEAARRLRTRVDQFMLSVKGQFPADHMLYGVERRHDAALRVFFASLLVSEPNTASPSVWDLLNARVSQEFLHEVAGEEELLSQPLTGNPTELLMHINLFNEKGPWSRVQHVVRGRLTEEESRILFMVETQIFAECD